MVLRFSILISFNYNFKESFILSILSGLLSLFLERLLTLDWLLISLCLSNVLDLDLGEDYLVITEAYLLAKCKFGVLFSIIDGADSCVSD